MSQIEPGKDLAAETGRVHMLEASAASQAGKPGQSMMNLILEMVRPYKKWLIIVFLAMLVETGMTLLAPGRSRW